LFFLGNAIFKWYIRFDHTLVR